MGVVAHEEIISALRDRIRDGRPHDPGWGVASVPAPASASVVSEAERVIGYRFPVLLHRIYLEIANGGVGPCGGIEGLRGGYASGSATSMVDLYRDYQAMDLGPEDPPPPPRGVVFLCDWGCAVWSLLDCRQPGGRMWGWEEGDRYPQDLTLAQWLQVWLDGRLDMPRATRESRDEPEAWFAPD